MTCTNNLKQLALACHTFHDATKALPGTSHQVSMTQFATVWGNANRYSYATCLLPYIEQTPLYDLVIENADTGLPDSTSTKRRFDPWSAGVTTDNVDYPSPWRTKVSAFVCPSGGYTPGPTALGINVYHVNRGDMWFSWDNNENRGPFGRPSHVTNTLGSITDGTSNTIGLSEVVPSLAAGSTKIKGGIAANIPRGGYQTCGPPIGCKLTAGANGAFKDGITAARGNSDVSKHWGDGQSIYTQFHTVLPPNSPSCSPAANNGENETLVSASSNHTGGVNVGVMDGAVVFVSDTIDAGNPEDTPESLGLGDSIGVHYTGPSLYGVWGRLGSQAGGESVSFP